MTTTGNPTTPLRIATRQSSLALAQAELVADGLRAAWPDLEVKLVPVATEGDRRRDVSTGEIGGKGVFTAAVQEAVLAGRADVAVHSAKDLPAAQVPGLVLAAAPRRADPRDALATREPVGGLDELPRGAAVGTGSPRRVALLRWLRPDLEVVPLRGNVETRLHKARGGELDAVVLAMAGLRRLGIADPDDPEDPGGGPAGPEWIVPLDPEVFTPAPGQGALAVEARADDTRTLGLLSALTDPASWVALRGERAFLARLGGSCTLPAGALLTQGGGFGGRKSEAPTVASGGPGQPSGSPPMNRGWLEMQGFLAAPDGKGMVRERLAGPPDDPEGLGEGLADRLLRACDPEIRAFVEASRRR
jgi:hydroxymethylbilane synthase